MTDAVEGCRVRVTSELGAGARVGLVGFDLSRMVLCVSAATGALFWLFLWLPGWSAAPAGSIDRLLILAVLVVVPLALSALRSRPDETPIARAQPLAALAVTASFAIEVGVAGALLALVWLAFASWLGGSLLCSRRREIVGLDVSAICLAAACIDLVVGACWLVAARGGWHPLRFGEPLVSLTAIHFHYAGFSLALLAGMTAAVARRGASDRRAVRVMVAPVLAGPFLVASGFLLSPLARFVAVSVFAAGVVVFAGLLLAAACAAHGPRRFLLGFAGASAAFTTLCAVAYAADEWLGLGILSISRMVAMHGWVNAFGFVLPALLALRSQGLESVGWHHEPR